jgi:hypothetical protein
MLFQKRVVCTELDIYISTSPLLNYLIYKQWKQQTKLNPKKQGKDNTNNAKNTE